MSGARHPDIEPRPEAADLKVLVVDDHETNRRIMHILLTELGCRPVLAACGEEAVDYAAEQPFDLIIMDVNMPGIDDSAAPKPMTVPALAAILSEAYRRAVGPTAGAAEGRRRNRQRNGSP